MKKVTTLCYSKLQIWNRHFVLCLMLLLLICLSGNAQVQVHPLANQIFDFDEIPSIDERTPLDEHIAYLTSPYYSLARETLAARYNAASPQERRHIADVFLETYDVLQTAPYSLCANRLELLCGSIWVVFSDDETAHEIAEHVARDVHARWAEARSERRFTDALHYMQRMGALGEPGLNYLMDMPWHTRDGAAMLGRIGGERAKSLLYEMYYKKDHDPAYLPSPDLEVRILHALASTYRKDEDSSTQAFLLDELPKYLGAEKLGVREHALNTVRILEDPKLLPHVEALQEELPEIRTALDVPAASTDHLSIAANNASRLVYYEENLERTWYHLTGLDEEVKKERERERRIAGIESSLANDEAGNFITVTIDSSGVTTTSDSSLPPAYAYTRRGMHLLEIELVKRDLPADRKTYHLLEVSRSPEEVWPEYASWPENKRREILEAVQGILNELHTNVPEGREAYAARIEGNVARWLEELGK